MQVQADFSVLYNYKSENFTNSLNVVSQNIIKVAKGKQDEEIKTILDQNPEFKDDGMTFNSLKFF